MDWLGLVWTGWVWILVPFSSEKQTGNKLKNKKNSWKSREGREERRKGGRGEEEGEDEEARRKGGREERWRAE